MIDRKHQEATLESDVTITGLVPQLTTPSRDHSDLVDIWFGVQWQERSAEWEESFATLAKGWRPDPRGPSYFDLFSYTANSGLIVARRVGADRAIWRQVEEQARALVDRVNREIVERRTPPPAPRRQSGGWTLRVRDASSGLLASLRWISEPKSPLPAVAKVPIHASHSSTGSP